jgi:uncharacterized protein YhaN
MRICRLDLLKYGHFTDTCLEFAPRSPDLHILVGPNEAGKSTALAAVEDLLFGMPRDSAYNFLHDYKDMRVGAVLERDGELLEVRRRKGNKDTLLGADGSPLAAGEAALKSFLGDADRGFFLRMFCLDHVRLAEGGHEILQARDEVGQMLFSVGAGIAGLPERLRSLEAEADGLWASRRAGKRQYYQAEDRLKEADRGLRDHTVSARAWQELKSVLDAKQCAYDELEQEIQRRTAYQRKLSRIRRVYLDVQRKSELEGSLTELGAVTPLPEDSEQRLAQAEREDADAAARMETLTAQLEEAKKQRVELVCDEALLRRAADIRELHERRIEVRAAQADLPQRQAELARAEAELQRLAGELEWQTVDTEALAARIPAPARVGAVRALLTRHGGLISEAKAAREALGGAEADAADLKQQLEALGASVDVSRLTAVLRATRGAADISARMASAEAVAAQARTRMQQLLLQLNPPVADAADLAAVPVPPQESVSRHRDAQRDLQLRRQASAEHLRAAEQTLGGHQAAHDRITRDEHAIPVDELERARSHRDSGWSLVRRRYLGNGPVSEDECRAFQDQEADLPRAYEKAVTRADALSDQRFDHAEATARLAETARHIAEQLELQEQLRQEATHLESEAAVMAADWEALWAECPFKPLTPDAMLVWMGTRTDVLAAMERCQTEESEVQGLCCQESAAAQSILTELRNLAVEPSHLENLRLDAVMAAADEVRRQHDRVAEMRLQLSARRRQATTDLGRRQEACDRAAAAGSAWQTQWEAALEALGLAAAPDEVISQQVEIIEKMRTRASRINDLRHQRIGKIEGAIAAFARDVAATVSAIAPDLTDTDPADAVLELERRSEGAMRVREAQQSTDKTIAVLTGRIEKREEARRGAVEVIRDLQRLAGVEDLLALHAAVHRSDQMRSLQRGLVANGEALAAQGDGLPADALQLECAAVDLDQIAAQEDALLRELEELRQRLVDAQTERLEARRQFDAIGGDDAAASAAADRQAALAEMGEIAAQYTRVRTSAVLLKWAIDRFRQERQAPLLQRAGQLFATLTGGSFAGLGLEFDAEDNVRLTGLRPDESAVGLDGMSTGTADQLYLALRVASVEDYLGRGTALPFVADDLFINFDDQRALAGLNVLGELARKTQVLFFTHHRHLVDLAREGLSETVGVEELSPGR